MLAQGDSHGFHDNVNWMRDGHPSLGWEAWAKAEDRGNQRTAGNRVVALAYGVLAILVIGGLAALVWAL